ncbi:hypothetical protein EDC01DRAFT_627535 [Geopyxis carbonaria]|nr:hypothetical protein EDC01DRAFT_627535 [Geopyxis carbonaria]
MSSNDSGNDDNLPRILPRDAIPPNLYPPDDVYDYTRNRGHLLEDSDSETSESSESPTPGQNTHHPNVPGSYAQSYQGNPQQPQSPYSGYPQPQTLYTQQQNLQQQQYHQQQHHQQHQHQHHQQQHPQYRQPEYQNQYQQPAYDTNGFRVDYQQNYYPPQQQPRPFQQPQQPYHGGYQQPYQPAAYIPFTPIATQYPAPFQQPAPNPEYLAQPPAPPQSLPVPEGRFNVVITTGDKTQHVRAKSGMTIRCTGAQPYSLQQMLRTTREPGFNVRFPVNDDSIDVRMIVSCSRINRDGTERHDMLWNQTATLKYGESFAVFLQCRGVCRFGTCKNCHPNDNNWGWGSEQP